MMVNGGNMYTLDTDTVVVPLRASDLGLIIGAIDTVIEEHIDDEDARAFTDQLHELDTLLRNIRATVINITATEEGN